MQSIIADFRRSPYVLYDMPFPIEEQEIKDLTQKFADSKMFFAVMLGDIMIGYICFHEENGSYDLGFCFHSNYHGNGFAFESCSTLMAYMEKEKSVKAFTAGTALQNTPSCKLLKKLGFILKDTEMLSFYKDGDGNDITFEGGIYRKEITE